MAVRIQRELNGKQVLQAAFMVLILDVPELVPATGLERATRAVRNTGTTRIEFVEFELK